ncbi:DICT sensory domain-containing protein [Natrinema marinum]|uniref:DICT sensory domain-containing protein n=1 Tax=Natrinema marinum TaxID=2961598 RepID=UPI0020C90C99|nr:DICT sensory domain-containing protein [Natrinema marinum]
MTANALAEFIQAIERRRKTLEVYTDDDAIVEELRRQFDTRNVDVTHRSLGALGDTGFVIVRGGDGAFRGAVGVDQFRAILSPTIHPPWKLGETDQDRSELFDFLENTLFTSYDRRQMLAAAREIEERAWRIGTGKLYVGFERPAALAPQADVYERLASHSRLTIALFLADAWDATIPDGVTAVSGSDGELGEYWFVVFDGGRNALEACALLAEERRDGAFYGFWTYDSGLVGELVSYLETTYQIA